MEVAKSDWILLILRKRPLDRIRIMKSLFLIWLRCNKNIPNYFHFKPYLYGPCSIEVYSELQDLLGNGLITQPPHSMQQWANYYLTDQGRLKSELAIKNVDAKSLELIGDVVEEVFRLSFIDLLRKVYRESPEFAINSVLKGVIRT